MEPSGGSNVIPRRAHPGLAGLGPRSSLTVDVPFEAGRGIFIKSASGCINFLVENHFIEPRVQ